ncbi:alanine racemase [Pseudofrankia sp. BMG5.37]|uniref:alanine racemase n=1 Tax=Pseudofrankia sp. BMG5.37 TaxID=3050035 RepID=UPI002894DEF3|nr:alanine racemase [Pseudofrankia sp. BMG5.37]MDT3438517.1 alanine racemase [Pseudofrankia sp. BMG5.37]
MDRIPLGMLVSIVEGELLAAGDDDDLSINSVAIHSERLQSDSVFFALRGRLDGHQFVSRALAGGAVAAVVSAGFHLPDPVSGPLIVVPDPLAALQRLAAWWRSRLAATVVAVIGSNGKTVTKDALVHAIGATRHVYGSSGSYNSQLGVALAMLDCPPDAEIAVFEAAATRTGEMERLRRMVRPDMAVLTNLGTRHLQNFGDRESYARELLSMVTELPAGGSVLLGADDAELRGWAEASAGVPVVVAGESPELPRLSQPTHVRQGLLVTATLPDGLSRDLVVPTPSREVLGDIGLAMSAATLLGAEPRSLLDTFADYTPTSTRMEMWRRADGATVVGDVATIDPLALSSAIRTARTLLGATGRLFVLLADPFDREVAEEDLRRVGSILLAERVDVVCGLQAKAHEAVTAGLGTETGGPRARLFADTDRMREFVATELTPDDVAFVYAVRETLVTGVWRRLVENTAPTRMFVDLAAVRSNVAAFRQMVGSHTRLMGVVKADAYGTNPVSLAHCLRETGVDWLGVATTDEGITLRRARVQMPILVFLGLPEEIEKMVRHGLTPLVYSQEVLDAVVSTAGRLGRPIEVHLEVDSGMHRTGLHPDLAIDALKRISGSGLRLTGLMTHLGCADDPKDDGLTQEQLDKFQKVWAAASELGFRNVLRHAAATAGTVRFPEARLDMVRIGLGLYGIHPSAATASMVSLTPAIGLVSRIVEIHDMEPGDWAGYGGRYRATVPGRRIALIPAGYYDSVPRSFSNVGFVLVNGRRCNIAGSVSMDSMAIDISEHPDAHLGNDVLVFGQYAGFSLPIEQAAEAMGTVPHELLTGVGPRVQRVFTQH